MDETRIQCNKEKGKKASSESFMWVIRSAECEEIQAAFFYYSRTRNGDIARELLFQFHEHLITDVYSGYEKVDDVTRALCWPIAGGWPRIIIPVLLFSGFCTCVVSNQGYWWKKPLSDVLIVMPAATPILRKSFLM